MQAYGIEIEINFYCKLLKFVNIASFDVIIFWFLVEFLMDKMFIIFCIYKYTVQVFLMSTYLRHFFVAINGCKKTCNVQSIAKQ